MTPREFHAGLRRLYNIDLWDLAQVMGHVPTADWERFRENPARWVIALPDATYDRFFAAFLAPKSEDAA